MLKELVDGGSITADPFTLASRRKVRSKAQLGQKRILNKPQFQYTSKNTPAVEFFLPEGRQARLFCPRAAPLLDILQSQRAPSRLEWPTRQPSFISAVKVQSELSFRKTLRTQPAIMPSCSG